MTTKARLDADRTAKPKTSIVGHARAGACMGPGMVQADEYRGDGGEKISLRPSKHRAGNFWGELLCDPKLKGREVQVHFKDMHPNGYPTCGRVIDVDKDLGTMTIAWAEGPRNFTCNFKIQDVFFANVKVEE